MSNDVTTPPPAPRVNDVVSEDTRHSLRRAGVIERQCIATNRNGERCRLKPIAFGTVCMMHGGKSPQAQLAATRRALTSLAGLAAETLGHAMERGPVCATCGRGADDKSHVAIKAAIAVLDRTGLGTTSTVVHETSQQRPEWVRYCTAEELRQFATIVSAAKERMATGEEPRDREPVVEGTVLPTEGDVNPAGDTPVSSETTANIEQNDE